MTSMSSAAPESLDDTIAREARDPQEAKDSKLILAALVARRNELGAAAQIPNDPKLSEQILAEARTRSTELHRDQTIGAAVSNRAAVAEGHGIPWWLWLAWIGAIAAAVTAFKYWL